MAEPVSEPVVREEEPQKKKNNRRRGKGSRAGKPRAEGAESQGKSQQPKSGDRPPKGRKPQRRDAQTEKKNEGGSAGNQQNRPRAGKALVKPVKVENRRPPLPRKRARRKITAAGAVIMAGPRARSRAVGKTSPRAEE